MINLTLLLQTLDFKKCDQPTDWPTDWPTDRTESRDAIASKKTKSTISCKKVEKNGNILIDSYNQLMNQVDWQINSLID